MPPFLWLYALLLITIQIPNSKTELISARIMYRYEYYGLAVMACPESIRILSDYILGHNISANQLEISRIPCQQEIETYEDTVIDKGLKMEGRFAIGTLWEDTECNPTSKDNRETIVVISRRLKASWMRGRRPETQANRVYVNDHTPRVVLVREGEACFYRHQPVPQWVLTVVVTSVVVLVILCCVFGIIGVIASFAIVGKIRMIVSRKRRRVSTSTNKTIE